MARQDARHGAYFAQINASLNLSFSKDTIVKIVPALKTNYTRYSKFGTRNFFLQQIQRFPSTFKIKFLDRDLREMSANLRLPAKAFGVGGVKKERSKGTDRDFGIC